MEAHVLRIDLNKYFGEIFAWRVLKTLYKISWHFYCWHFYVFGARELLNGEDGGF